MVEKGISLACAGVGRHGGVHHRRPEKRAVGRVLSPDRPDTEDLWEVQHKVVLLWAPLDAVAEDRVGDLLHQVELVATVVLVRHRDEHGHVLTDEVAGEGHRHVELGGVGAAVVRRRGVEHAASHIQFVRHVVEVGSDGRGEVQLDMRDEVAVERGRDVIRRVDAERGAIREIPRARRGLRGARLRLCKEGASSLSQRSFGINGDGRV